jgi:hypothetical protein
MILKNMLVLCLAFAVAGSIGACNKESSSVEGTGGKKLTLDNPGDHTIQQGETDKLDIEITRTNFDEAVDVEIADLPAGVTVSGGSKKTIPAGQAKLDDVTLVAAADAAIVKDHRVSLTATGPEGKKVTQYFKVTVRSK